MACAYFIAHFPHGFLPIRNMGEPPVLNCFIFKLFHFPVHFGQRCGNAKRGKVYWEVLGLGRRCGRTTHTGLRRSKAPRKPMLFGDTPTSVTRYPGADTQGIQSTKASPTRICLPSSAEGTRVLVAKR
jgi:hypothetical protein